MTQRKRKKKEKKGGRERENIYIYAFVERRERLSILLDTLSERQKKKKEENHKSNIDQIQCYYCYVFLLI